MTFWVVRHAQPRVAPGICYGALDVPAEPEATARAAQALAHELPQGAQVFVSVLQRCELFAQHLRGLRPDLTFKPEPRLVEMHFGMYEGVAWADIDKDAMDAWTDNFWAHRFGGQESVAEFMARVAEVWDACQPARTAGQVQVWITHAGVARAVSLLAQGVRRIERADQWPSQAPAFGQWLRVLP
ncbi:histidine phosphatase family protein [Rhodoferax sp.]|uniref:histidine phosphatase family protein n=1 Tax=Rhodoferax sp. TaxID=50421 RepID=UPI002ACDB96E|nr:histidine phosphatase family protein [Rhodoferax sp.]MDZ7918720.1 histidine phosphatase family protein [Rhodoferax sp.]